jgi:hypothetical protein
MKMNIQSAVPAPSKLMDLANAGEAMSIISPVINPTFIPLLIVFIFVSSSL